MNNKQQHRRIYIDYGGRAYSAFEIVPLAFSSDPKSDEAEADRQLSLPVREFNKMAKKGGYFINPGIEKRTGFSTE
jgi:hypothetical protein